MDLQGKNEEIVSQIQNGIGDRQELLAELWTCNLGLVQKIIHRCTGLQKDIDRQVLTRKPHILKNRERNLIAYPTSSTMQSLGIFRKITGNSSRFLSIVWHLPEPPKRQASL